MAEGKKVILTHPILGDRPFTSEVAKKLMSKEFTGGWEFKKPSVGEKSPRFLKDKNAAANASTDKGETQVPQEEGSN